VQIWSRNTLNLRGNRTLKLHRVEEGLGRWTARPCDPSLRVTTCKGCRTRCAIDIDDAPCTSPTRLGWTLNAKACTQVLEIHQVDASGLLGAPPLGGIKLSGSPSMRLSMPVSLSNKRERLHQPLRKNVKRLRGGLVFKSPRLLYHSTLGSRVEKRKEETQNPAPSANGGASRGRDSRPSTCISQFSQRASRD
jgi:hypothetical protein